VSRSEIRTQDAFTARVLAALQAGASIFGYVVQPTIPDDEVLLDAVVEVALLRIGVLVQRGRRSIGGLLADIKRELATNRQRVAAVLGVASGDETELQHYQLLDATNPNAVILTWAPEHGLDAVPGAVPLVVDLVTGRAPGLNTENTPNGE
jgi:hypothetical protein